MVLKQFINSKYFTMTVDKRDNITIPQWMLSLLVSVIGAVFVFWGLWATVKEKVMTSERNIEILRTEKVNKSEFDLVLEQLRDIKQGVDDVNKKVDIHIKETK